MIRRSFMWLGTALLLGVALFQVKYEVQALEQRLQALNRDIIAKEEAIHVLRAEWAYLNRPERLAALAERHLDLAPITPDQISRWQEVAVLAAGGTAHVQARDAAANGTENPVDFTAFPGPAPAPAPGPAYAAPSGGLRR